MMCCCRHARVWSSVTNTMFTHAIIIDLPCPKSLERWPTSWFVSGRDTCTHPLASMDHRTALSYFETHVCALVSVIMHQKIIIVAENERCRHYSVVLCPSHHGVERKSIRSNVVPTEALPIALHEQKRPTLKNKHDRVRVSTVHADSSRDARRAPT